MKKKCICSLFSKIPKSLQISPPIFAPKINMKMTNFFKLIFLLSVFLCLKTSVFAQNKIEVLVKDSTTKATIVGVNVYVKGTTIGIATNEDGKAQLSGFPSGKQTIVFSSLGYQKKELEYEFPLKDIVQPILILMSSSSQEITEVTVSAMRNNSRIEDLPTKIEVLGFEEMSEENSIKPGNISGLLGDIGGIQMQQTSSASGNMNARIQGLNGRYSQILKDGMPIFGGFSGSFSILQVPPLDLRQIEIIKGSASTLFGGDAIGGTINLVSKKPTDKLDVNLLLNQTTLKETDINAYISKKYGKFGFTLFAGHINQKAFDVNGDGFSDTPELMNYTVHPKLFFYFDPKTTLSLGYTGTFENRKGGDMSVLDNGSSADHQYLIEHQSKRNTAELNFEKNMADGSVLSLKGSSSFLDRTIQTPNYKLDASQTLYYSELSYFLKKEKYDFVLGANLTGDIFNNRQVTQVNIPNYQYSTIGFFAQNDWRITEKLLLESGLRYDIHSENGGFLLPHLSVMYKFAPDLTARINGGFGYKIPVIFGYLDEETDLNRIVTMQSALKAEKSQGANFDINYSTRLWDKLSVTINQSFFYTILNSPVVVSTDNSNKIILANADKAVVTNGLQSYMRMAYDEFEFYLSYVYTHAEKTYDPSNPWFLTTPEHSLATTLTFEPSENWRIGFEGSYIGSQFVENNSKTPSYPFLALMAQFKTGKFTFVLNCENMLDYRQKDYLIPPIVNPSFKTLWGPIEGRVFNLSVNYRL